MKRILIFLAVLACFFNGCEKQPIEHHTPAPLGRGIIFNAETMLEIDSLEIEFVERSFRCSIIQARQDAERRVEIMRASDPVNAQ
jgi:hypothetical protein